MSVMQVTAIYDIGCALGAVTAFIWGEALGRKRSLILANIIVIIGAAIQTASYSYAQMAVSRVIAGVGVGLSTVAVPILQVRAACPSSYHFMFRPLLSCFAIDSLRHSQVSQLHCWDFECVKLTVCCAAHNRGALLVVQSALIIIGAS